MPTGDDIVPGDILKLLRKCGLRTVTQQINNTYETGEWSKDLSDVNSDCLKKKPRATECSDHHTISWITNTLKTIARMLGLSFERKTEDVFGENQSGFRRGKGASDTIGMLRIPERTLEIDDESCACFIDWQRHLQILKLTGIDWRERRVIRKLYVDQCVKLKIDQGETRKVKIGRRVRH